MDRELTQYDSTEALALRQALYSYAIGPTRGDVVRNAMDGFEGMSVLDAGCGNGKLIAEILHPFRDVTVTVLDPSEAMVTEAVRRCSSWQTIGMVTDLSTIQIGRFFDRIILGHVLHLTNDPVLAIENAIRHLQPSGRCIVTMHSGSDFPKRREWISWFERTFHNQYRAKRDTLNLQNIETFTTGLAGTFKKQLIKTEICLTDPAPYLDYISTERHRFEHEPTDEEWKLYHDHVRTDIESTIARHGVFVEQHDWGLVTIQLS